MIALKNMLLVLLLCCSTLSYSLDRHDIHHSVDTVADTWHSVTQNIKHRALRIWYWNTIRPEDYAADKETLEALQVEVKELEEKLEAYRSSIKNVPNSLYAYLEALIKRIKKKRERIKVEKRVQAYERIRQIS